MGTIELPDLSQGTDEWHAQRRGIITASVVGRLITTRARTSLEFACPDCGVGAWMQCISKVRKPGDAPKPIKGPHSERVSMATSAKADEPPILVTADDDTAQGLTLTLAAERLTGWTEETPMSADMWRGVESEPFARAKYAEHYAPVTEIGFMLRTEDDWTLGYSPDGLVGEDGLIEIKAPRSKTHVRTILADEVPAFYMPQLQAGLLVSGRSWIDFVSFVGGMPLYTKRVEPDPVWFDAITAACIAFQANAAQIVADYKTRVADMPKTDRLDFELRVA